MFLFNAGRGGAIEMKKINPNGSSHQNATSPVQNKQKLRSMDSLAETLFPRQPLSEEIKQKIAERSSAIARAAAAKDKGELSVQFAELAYLLHSREKEKDGLLGSIAPFTPPKASMRVSGGDFKASLEMDFDAGSTGLSIDSPQLKLAEKGTIENQLAEFAEKFALALLNYSPSEKMILGFIEGLDEKIRQAFPPSRLVENPLENKRLRSLAVFIQKYILQAMADLNGAFLPDDIKLFFQPTDSAHGSPEEPLYKIEICKKSAPLAQLGIDTPEGQVVFSIKYNDGTPSYEGREISGKLRELTTYILNHGLPSEGTENRGAQ